MPLPLQSREGDEGGQQQPQQQRVVLINSSTQEEFLASICTNRYKLVELIGEGGYGTVYSAIDTVRNEYVAIKKLPRCLDNVSTGIRSLRELKLNRLLCDHPNIVQIYDIVPPCDRDTFTDIFVVFQIMPANLEYVIDSGLMTPAHSKYIMYQLLCAVHYMHAHSILHRDLKPGNILIDGRNQIRVCDFGLSRLSSGSVANSLFWTNYVTTRWYRAPELILEEMTEQTTALDMWSIGCIFGELLSGGKAMFPGESAVGQIELIVDTIGGLSLDEYHSLANPRSRRMMVNYVNKEATVPLEARFADADPDAVDLLKRILVFDPKERLSALDAIRHKYFADLQGIGIGKLPGRIPEHEFEFEDPRTHTSVLREKILMEIDRYHPEGDKNGLTWDDFEFRPRSASEQFKVLLRNLRIVEMEQSLAATQGTTVDEGEDKDKLFSDCPSFMSISKADLYRYTGYYS